MAKLIENTVILIAGGLIFVAGMIAVGILVVYCTALVMARRLKAAVGFQVSLAG
jgi:hypothetical protein